MRKVKIINIEGVGEVTVKEVAPFAVYQAMSAKNKVEEVSTLVLECVSLSKDQAKKLYASEIEQLVDAFIEVNNSFLAIAGKLFLKQTMSTMVSELSKILPQVFADSYKQVMAMPGITAGAAS